MYRTIVLAYDGTAASAAALQQGLSLARLCGARLHLLGIAVTTGGMALAESVGADDVWGREAKQLEALLERVAGDARAQGIEVATAVRQGSPADEIEAYVAHSGADLLVLGHSDKGWIGRWFQGSVGARMLARLPCSLLVAGSA